MIKDRHDCVIEKNPSHGRMKEKGPSIWEKEL